jgi:hypothetical protein
MSKPNKTSLLAQAIEAHGGLERWNTFDSIIAQLSIGGELWSYKQRPKVLDRITFSGKTRQERVTLSPFGSAGGKSEFQQKRLEITTAGGAVIQQSDDPRARFADHTANAPWDDLHVAYFGSYAMWTYLTTPFLYTYPGFVTEELEPWEENGEIWRRLEVTFPDHIATHTRRQISYFGPDGLLRRHDYTVDVLGGASGANYASEYRTIDGITVPTKRRVYARGPDNRRVPEPTLVTIDIATLLFR